MTRPSEPGSLLLFARVREGGTGVPYWRPTDGEPASHPYVDLRSHPELIDALPEVRDRPQLRRALEVLNHTDGPFRTIGCDECWQPQDSLGMLTSYVHFCAFDPQQFADVAVLYRMFHAYSRHANAAGLHRAVSGEFEMQQTFFVEENSGGWAATFYLRTQATTLDLARDQQDIELRAFVDFVEATAR